MSKRIQHNAQLVDKNAANSLSKNMKENVITTFMEKINVDEQILRNSTFIQECFTTHSSIYNTITSCILLDNIMQMIENTPQEILETKAVVEIIKDLQERDHARCKEIYDYRKIGNESTLNTFILERRKIKGCNHEK